MNRAGHWRASDQGLSPPTSPKFGTSAPTLPFKFQENTNPKRPSPLNPNPPLSPSSSQSGSERSFPSRFYSRDASLVAVDQLDDDVDRDVAGRDVPGTPKEKKPPSGRPVLSFTTASALRRTRRRLSDTGSRLSLLSLIGAPVEDVSPYAYLTSASMELPAASVRSTSSDTEDHAAQVHEREGELDSISRLSVSLASSPASSESGLSGRLRSVPIPEPLVIRRSSRGSFCLGDSPEGGQGIQDRPPSPGSLAQKSSLTNDESSRVTALSTRKMLTSASGVGKVIPARRSSVADGGGVDNSSSTTSSLSPRNSLADSSTTTFPRVLPVSIRRRRSRCVSQVEGVSSASCSLPNSVGTVEIAMSTKTGTPSPMVHPSSPLCGSPGRPRPMLRKRASSNVEGTLQAWEAAVSEGILTQSQAPGGRYLIKSRRSSYIDSAIRQSPAALAVQRLPGVSRRGSLRQGTDPQMPLLRAFSYAGSDRCSAGSYVVCAPSPQSNSQAAMDSRIREHVIAAKKACDAQLRRVIEDLNEYVERSLQYANDRDTTEEVRDSVSDSSSEISLLDEEERIMLFGEPRSAGADVNSLPFEVRGDEQQVPCSRGQEDCSVKGEGDIENSHRIGSIDDVPYRKPSPFPPPSTGRRELGDMPAQALPSGEQQERHGDYADRPSIAEYHRKVMHATQYGMRQLRDAVTGDGQGASPAHSGTTDDDVSEIGGIGEARVSEGEVARVTQSPRLPQGVDGPFAAPEIEGYSVVAEDSFYPTPFIGTLLELIALCQQILDVSPTHLLRNRGRTADVVREIQALGERWRKNPDWPCRNSYVRVLLSVASLSRVVEWWEAEHEARDSNVKSKSEGCSPSCEQHTAMSQVGAEAITATAAAPTAAAPTASDSTTTPFEINIDVGRHMVETGGECEGRENEEFQENEKEKRDVEDEEEEYAEAEADFEGGEIRSHDESVNDEFKLAVGQSQSSNILVELTLDGNVRYVSPSWRDVIGTDPAALIGGPISAILADEDKMLFASATEQFLKDESRSLELRCTLRSGPAHSGTAHQSFEIEGKGMLMVDRTTGEANHTMWVIRPVIHEKEETYLKFTSAKPGLEGISTIDVEGRSPKAGGAPTHPLSLDSANALQEPLGEDTGMVDVNQPSEIVGPPSVLCRICERLIPPLFFVRHAEYCLEMHKAEMALHMSNEGLGTVRGQLCEMLAVAEATTASWLGFPIPNDQKVGEGTTGNASSAHPVEVPEESRKQSVEYLKQLIQEVDVVMSINAATFNREEYHNSIISAAIIKSGETDTPLSPKDYYRVIEAVVMPPTPTRPNDGTATEPLGNDEDIGHPIISSDDSDDVKTHQAFGWHPPATDDPFLAQLGSNVHDLIKAKLDALYDMKRSIEKAEQMRQEWLDATQVAAPDVPTESDIATEVLSDAVDAQVDSHIMLPNEKTLLSPLTMSPAPFEGSGPLLERVEPANVAPPADPAADGSRKRTGTSSNGPRQHHKSLSVDIPTQKAIAKARYMASQSVLLPALVVGGRPYHCNSGSGGSISAGRSPVSPTFGATSQPPRQPGIRDFEIIKPVSKGAYGSVYLAKKRTTGEYFAIKVLEKSDMVSKNQVTNVKAERMILMSQTDSPFVVKLYFTFQSKDYLYLVMEYLNGGDASALIKAVGGLSTDWARQYVAEVVAGLEFLHSRGVVHRDLKPDNLLIDQNGHLKLTDFGLSRVGFLGRRARGDTSTNFLKLSQMHPPASPATSGDFTNVPCLLDSPSSSAQLQSQSFFGMLLSHSRNNSMCSTTSLDAGNAAVTPDTTPATPVFEEAGSVTPGGTLIGLFGPGGLLGPDKDNEKVVGTPDYLAPESILGYCQDNMVDWWALGVILYEFLYGFPPFHADTPDAVFENILSRNIDWHENEVDIDPDARDLMERLMCTNTSERLGANGAQEVKAHPFFKGVNWDSLYEDPAAFVPNVEDAEDTDYFDSRGVVMKHFDDNEIKPEAGKAAAGCTSTTAAMTTKGDNGKHRPQLNPDGTITDASGNIVDFGSFVYKNLPVLEKANNETILRLRSESVLALSPPHHPGDGSPNRVSARRRPRNVSMFEAVQSSLSSNTCQLPEGTTTVYSAADGSHVCAESKTPSTSASEDHGDATDKLSDAAFAAAAAAVATPSETHLSPSERTKMSRRQRMRTMSMSGVDCLMLSQRSSQSSAIKHGPGQRVGTPGKKVKDVLIADDNPIACKILELILKKLKCRSLTVRNGVEAIRCAMGEVKFDIIFMDCIMPIIDGESAARMIKSTANVNRNTPVVAVTAYEHAQVSPAFDDIIYKPITKQDVIRALQLLD